jgi:hypothetical protein
MMRLWNPLSAAVTLGVILCCGQSPARTWTDITGKHKIEGEFVKLADGQVDIRREDGKLVRIPLEKLSEADQQHARKAVKVGEESPFSVTGDEEKPAAKPKAPTEGKETQTVVAEGVGTTKEEALKDAFRAAVRQVVGEVVDGETLVKNDDLVKDQVLTYSDGFIPKHEEVSVRREGGLFRMTIRAQVERRGVIMKLKAANVAIKVVDGQSMFGNIASQLGAEQDATALVRKALEGFPGNCIDVNVVGEPQLLDKDQEKAKIEVRIAFRVNSEAYLAFAGRLSKTLDAVAKDKGEFSSQFTLNH